MTTLKQLERLRGKYNSQIRTIQMVLFVATAACVAAARKFDS